MKKILVGSSVYESNLEICGTKFYDPGKSDLGLVLEPSGVAKDSIKYGNYQFFFSLVVRQRLV
jgi:hypothetical protein